MSESLHNKLSSTGRWVVIQRVKRMTNGKFRATIETDGNGGKRRFEAENDTPVEALSDAAEKAS